MRARGRTAVSTPERAAFPANVLERIDRLLHELGARLLSQSWIRVLVWLSMLIVLIVNASTMPVMYDAVVALAIVVAVLHAATLVWALRRPWFAVGAATVAVAATTLLTAVGQGDRPWPLPVITTVTCALMVLILAVREKWLLPVAGAVLPIMAGTLVGLLWHTGGWGPFATNVITAFSVCALVVIFGILIHQWQQSRAELLEQQEIAATAHERRLLMEERNRIARELHDVVAHGLSVISIQASTLQYRIADVPAEVVAELDAITESARNALVEMRGLLAVLRQEDSENLLAPQPTMTFLPSLIESTRRGAESVRLHVVGELDDPHVSEATSLSVYRIVQEALSNALRHAPGSDIVVSVAITSEHVAVEVLNSPPTAPARTSEGHGFGLRGMRERATFVQGSLTAEPTREGGFAVRAMLPCRQLEEQPSHTEGAPDGETQAPPSGIGS
jgi:signal transduction histidine kinase